MKEKTNKNCNPSTGRTAKEQRKNNYGYRPTGDRNSDWAKSPTGGSSIKNKKGV